MGIDFDTPTEQVRKELLRRVMENMQTVEGDSHEGVPVITRAALARAFDEALPDLSDHGATVRTPARLDVLDVCPNCGIVAHVAQTINSRLEITEKGRKLGLQIQSKPIFHACGQQTLDAATDPTLGLDDAPKCTCALGGADAERDEWSTTIEECAVHGEAAQEDISTPVAVEGELLTEHVADDDPDALLPEAGAE